VIFFARYVAGPWVIIALGLSLVILSDVLFNRDIADDQEKRIGWRIFSAWLWPIYLLSKAGRRHLSKIWTGVF
jgi:hypothetical protein